MQKLPSKEKEEVMEIMTSWKKEGVQLGSVNIILRLLNKRFGKIDKSTENTLSKLSVKNLEELSESLFDFKDVNDLQVWLSKFQNKN